MPKGPGLGRNKGDCLAIPCSGHHHHHHHYHHVNVHSLMFQATKRRRHQAHESQHHCHYGHYHHNRYHHFHCRYYHHYHNINVDTLRGALSGNEVTRAVGIGDITVNVIIVLTLTLTIIIIKPTLTNVVSGGEVTPAPVAGKGGCLAITHNGQHLSLAIKKCKDKLPSVCSCCKYRQVGHGCFRLSVPARWAWLSLLLSVTARWAWLSLRLSVPSG